jgi:hypothetical protein
MVILTNIVESVAFWFIGISIIVAYGFYKDHKYVVFFKDLYRNYPNYLNYETFLAVINYFYSSLSSNISVFVTKYSILFKNLKNKFKK